MNEEITAASGEEQEANLKQGPDIYEFGSDKTQIITRDLLSKSIRHEGKYGKMLDTKPIQVWAMLDLIAGILNGNDVNFKEDPVHVQRRASGTYLNDSDRNNGYTKSIAPIEKWKFDKVINLIQLPNIYEGDNEGVGFARNATIGVTLNDLGLSVAFGMNVHECSNFNVYGGTILRTYSYQNKPGMQWELMKIKINDWIGKLDQIWQIQNTIASSFQETELKQNHVIEEVVGELYINALKSAYFQGSETPFNTHELSEFVQKVIQQRKDEEQIGNVWDLYNWGTSIMKPGSMDIGEIANNSNLWADHLAEYFNIPYEDATILDEGRTV